MNSLEYVLYRTRYTVKEACDILNIPYPTGLPVTLLSCSSCGVWLKKMKVDQDGLEICDLCLETYGS